MVTLFRVSKAMNGFSIEVYVPLKKDEKSEYSCSSCYETINVSTEEELQSTISKLIPMLETEYKDEDAFEMAFKAATK